MCGIVGAIANRDVTPVLLDGLKRLEYRGYDSAGIVVINANNNHFLCNRVVGKVNQLEASLKQQPISGHIGIAHTRWATHGKPSLNNAHPHIVADTIALVHNGIIENHESLRKQLIDKGCIILSDTDSELIAHLIFLHINDGMSFLDAVHQTTKELEGAYALGILYAKEPNHLIAVRHGSPLVIGIGEHENFIGSDTLALQPVTQQFIFLEDDDIADIQANQFTIYDKNKQQVTREQHTLPLNNTFISKEPYRHFMEKEIYEQPTAIINTMEGRITEKEVLVSAFGANAADIFKQVSRVEIVACGTSYHAGIVARYWLEEIARLPCQVEIASENRYRKKVVEPNTLFVALSQSGETADTLAALRQAKENHSLATLTICNVAESSMVRESDLALITHAGPEVGVASTKAFTTQLVSLFMLTLVLARYHGLSAETETQLIQLLRKIPYQLTQALSLHSSIEAVSHSLANKHHALFLGRGIEFPIAQEGALKLKEISYIHAEAYAAGELKHGPIALIDKNMPVIVLAPADDQLEKLKSNIQEVLARDGSFIIFADKQSRIEQTASTRVITMPSVDKLTAPIIYTIAVQLLAYHVAVIKGTDIDQPRNLAKSVTVE